MAISFMPGSSHIFFDEFLAKYLAGCYLEQLLSEVLVKILKRLRIMKMKEKQMSITRKEMFL